MRTQDAADFCDRSSRLILTSVSARSICDLGDSPRFNSYVERDMLRKFSFVELCSRYEPLLFVHLTSADVFEIASSLQKARLQERQTANMFRLVKEACPAVSGRSKLPGDPAKYFQDLFDAQSINSGDRPKDDSLSDFE